MEEQEEKLTGRGGAGRGQGRKPKDKVKTQRVSIGIPIDILDIINRNYPNRSDFVQKAIKEKLRRECLL